MVNPQTEEGHTKIANEILDAICRIRIPGAAAQILWFIIRKTYGYRQHWDYISNSQFVQATGLRRTHVQRNIKILINMNLIVTKNGNKNGHMYRFNKQYDKWQVLPRMVTNTKLLPEMGHTKESNILLYNNTKSTVLKNNNTHARKGKFTKPPVPEIDAYILKQDIKSFTGQEFFDHYEAIGWVIGRNKTPMKSWQATVRTWKSNHKRWAKEKENQSGSGMQEYRT